jgi:hypothetical protein
MKLLGRFLGLLTLVLAAEVKPWRRLVVLALRPGASRATLGRLLGRCLRPVQRGQRLRFPANMAGPSTIRSKQSPSYS